MIADPVTQFADAIRAAGLTVPERIEADGKLHRFASNGDRRDDAGYYARYLDGIPAGHFGCWRTGVKETWHASIGRKLSFAESEALAQVGRRPSASERTRKPAGALKPASERMRCGRQRRQRRPIIRT